MSITPIPKKLRDALKEDPEYKICSLHGHGECAGRITWEHAILYAGKRINERWAIIPLCELHHAVGRFQDAGTCRKDLNVWVALNRASDDDLARYSKVVDYKREKERLNGIYGVFYPPVIPSPSFLYPQGIPQVVPY